MCSHQLHIFFVFKSHSQKSQNHWITISMVCFQWVESVVISCQDLQPIRTVPCVGQTQMFDWVFCEIVYLKLFLLPSLDVVSVKASSTNQLFGKQGLIMYSKIRPEAFVFLLMGLVEDLNKSIQQTLHLSQLWDFLKLTTFHCAWRSSGASWHLLFGRGQTKGCRERYDEVVTAAACRRRSWTTFSLLHLSVVMPVLQCFCLSINRLKPKDLLNFPKLRLWGKSWEFVKVPACVVLLCLVRFYRIQAVGLRRTDHVGVTKSSACYGLCGCKRAAGGEM